jgi:hypothetical protein
MYTLACNYCYKNKSHLSMNEGSLFCFFLHHKLPSAKFQYDYNESLNLCYSLMFFHIIVVYFSLYYSIVDKMLVENI